MPDISGQLIKDSYSYILQVDTSTGYVYRVNGNVPVNPIFSSGLTVFSAFTFVDGNQSNGYVLTSDGSGNARWATVSGASVASVTASTGLSGNSTTGAITLINTAPDKTVVITGGTNIQIISDYPNFGINFTGQTSSAFTGGTVSGATNFTNGLTANTISATTYYNLPDNVTGKYLPLSGGTVTGATIFQSGLTANTISGGTIYGNGANLTNVVNSITASTGLSGNSTTGAITLINTAPDKTVTISGGTGISTGGTYPNFSIVNTAPDKTVTITGGTNIQIIGTYPDFGINFTGQTSFPYLALSGGTVTGNTIFQSGLTANTLNVTGNTLLSGLTATTISATTYNNLPNTLYTGDGTLLSNRIVNLSSYTLTLSGKTNINYSSTTFTDSPLVIRNTSINSAISNVISFDCDATGVDQPVFINFASTRPKGFGFYSSSSDITSTPDGAAFQMYNNASVNFPGQIFFDSGAHNNAAIIFRTTQSAGTITERIRITSGGNVGIGTDSPTNTLHVFGINPLRLRGVQPLQTDTYFLTIDKSGEVHSQGIPFLKNLASLGEEIIVSNQSIFNPADLTVSGTTRFIIEANADYYILGDLYNYGDIYVYGTLKVGGVIYNYGTITGSGIIE